MVVHTFIVFFVLLVTINCEEQLPRNLIPRLYSIDLELDTEGRTFTGAACIAIYCTQNTGKIKLHGKQQYGHLTIDMVTIKVMHIAKTPEEITVIGKDYDIDTDILTITTTQLKSKNQYYVCIYYDGVIGETNEYIIWESSTTSPKQFIIATNYKVQRLFPCFDEPSMKAVFYLRVTVKSSEYVYSNARTKKIDKLTGEKAGWIEKKFELTVPLDPSQISFVVTNIKLSKYTYGFSHDWWSKFLYREEAKNRIKLNGQLLATWVSPKYSSLSPSSIFPIVRFIVIPIEEKLNTVTWGLAVISEMELSQYPREAVLYNIYNRMASQCFGGMVSPDKWDSEWIYSALSTYVAYLQMKGQPFLKVLPTAMWDGLSDNLEENMKKGLDPFHKVGFGIKKGLMLLRMIHSTMGERKFVQALKGFIKTFLYKSAGPNKLWNVLDSWTKRSSLPAGTTWSMVMKSWTEQIGYPLVTATSIGNGQFKLVQERFFGRYQDKIEHNMDPARKQAMCWWIPVTFTSASRLKKKLEQTQENWLGCGNREEITITTKARVGDWVIFNLKYSALYRVKYDSASWDLIVNAFKTKHEIIDDYIRSQIVNDALALAWMGYVDYEYVFKLLPYLKKEKDIDVWETFFLAASSLSEILQFSQEAYSKFQVYLRSFLDPALDSIYTESLFAALGKTSGVYLGEADALFYSWSCTIARTERCRKEAKDKFEEWFQAGQLIVGANSGPKRSFFLTILCTVLNEQKEYDETWKTRVDFFIDALKEDWGEKSYRHLFVKVFRCTSDKTTITSLLEWASSPAEGTGTKEEKMIGLISLTQGVDSFLPTLEYFYNNIDKIQSNFPDKVSLGKIVNALTSKMSVNQVSEMREFLSNRPELDNKYVSLEFRQASEIANVKSTWMEENEEKILTALSKFN